MFKTNPDRPIIGNAEIVEWDIHSGNTSIMKAYHLLDPKRIEIMEKLRKKDRVVAIGKIMRADKEFSKKLEAGFNDAVTRFILLNNLEEYDILSVKRDAAFIVNREITTPIVLDGVEFLRKNTYHGFMLLGTLEVYFKNDQTVDIKGIGDDKYKLHADGMIDFLQTVMHLYERKNQVELHTYLHEFLEAYRRKQLPYVYYRQFNSDSFFALGQAHTDYCLQDAIMEDDMDRLNITYNLIKVILPIIQMTI